MATVPTATHPAEGDDGHSFAVNLEAWLDNQDDATTGVNQTLENRIEASNNLAYGTGVYAGSYTAPLLSAGAGLSVNLGTFKALIGFPIDKSSGGSVVGSLTPSATNTIFLKQDGSFTSNTTGTNGGTTANPWIEMGTATTNTTGVTGVADTFDLVQSLGFGGGIIPVGGIIMWSGAIVDIPNGWQLCDGSNGTPDLRDRFIVGAGSTYSPAATGGAATHSHTVNSHSHTVNSHSHSQSANTGSGTANLLDHPDHTHFVSGTATFAIDILPTSNTTTLNYTAGASSLTLPTDTHDHNWTAGGSVGPPAGTLNHVDTGHTHPLGGSTGSSSPSTDSQSPGTNSVSSLPPYLALAFIQRIA